MMTMFSRRACTSWRFVEVDGHEGHARPSDCPKCWRACGTVLTREQWAAGIRRCEQCVQSLVHCPIVAVRRALIEEDGLGEDVLRVLVTDSNGPVSMRARRKLDELITARAPKEPERPFGEVALELPASPRRAHRALAATNPQPVLTAPRQSVWDN